MSPPINEKKDSLLQEKVNTQLVEYVYSQTPFGLFASIFCATILVIGLYTPQNAHLLFSWYAIIVSVMCVRLFLVHCFFHFQNKLHYLKWRNLFILGVILSGSCWGFIAGSLLPYQNVMHFTLTILILCGMTAGAVSALSGILAAGIIYLLLVLVPLIISVFLTKNQTYFLFNLSTIIYLFYLISLCLKSHHLTKKLIKLSVENSLLLEDLSNAKKDLERTNSKLLYTSENDLLTGLKNRAAFEKYFANALKNAEREQNVLALIYLNIDKFKEVNETYNYEVGNQLLKKLADRLQTKFPANTIISRFGGDEFVIALQGYQNGNDISFFLQDIQNALNLPFEIENYNILVTTSMGVSLFPLDGLNFDTLLRNADKSMSSAKKRGGGQVCFNSEMNPIVSPVNLFPR